MEAEFWRFDVKLNYFAIAIVLLGSATLRVDPGVAQQLVTFINNGPSSNRVDMVFLGDGYTSTQMGTYATHVNSMVDYMFNMGQNPFPRYENYFNAHRIEVISNQSGADDPTAGVYVDTALDSTYLYDGVTQRLLYVNTSKANAAMNAGIGGAFTVDMRMVTVNSTQYGGGGGTYAVYAGGNSSATDVALHELGHSFAGLADEYWTAGTTYTGSEPNRPNVTTDPTGSKWAQWLGYSEPGMGTIGAYQGGHQYANGIYRPSNNSKMRSLGQPFDAVSREEIILDIYRIVDPLDAYLGNSSTLVNPTNIWVDAIDPTIIRHEWFVDGNLVGGAIGETFNPREYGFGLGTYTIRSRSYDDTPWVRKQLDLLEQQVTWTINYTVPNALTWAGNVNSTWDTSSTNWTGSASFFANTTSSVAFGNATSTNAVAIQAGGVQPHHVFVDNNAAHTYTFSGGAITGTGGLTKNGIGRLVLTNDNAFTGGTTILGGTLQLGAGGSSGSVLGNIHNLGSLIIDRADNFTFSGSISGPGTLEKNGAGTLILTGNNTFTGATTVNHGALDVRGGFASRIYQNSGSIQVAGGGSLSNQAGLEIGGLLNVGAGGSIVGSGTTFIRGGGTIVGNGAVAGHVMVDAGGVLQGTGSVGAVNIASGGKLSPGNSVGQLTVDGSGVTGGGSLTLNGGADVVFEFRNAVGNTPGADWDYIDLGTGVLNLNADNIQLNNRIILHVDSWRFDNNGHGGGTGDDPNGFDDSPATPGNVKEYFWKFIGLTDPSKIATNGQPGSAGGRFLVIDDADAAGVFGLNNPFDRPESSLGRGTFRVIEGNFSNGLGLQGYGLYVHYSAVPEPGSLLLTGLAAAGGWYVRRRRKRSSPEDANATSTPADTSNVVA